MLSKSAHLYDAIYASFKNYEMEAERVHAIIQERVPRASKLLDVACGTGLHLEHLASHYEVEGVDLDPGMLDIARQRLPGVPLTVGGMVDFDLGRTFDAVTCLFSSIRLSAQRGGAGQGNHQHGPARPTRRHFGRGALDNPRSVGARHPEAIFVDRPGIKIARMSRIRRRRERSTVVFHYLVGTEDGVDCFTEQHESRLHSHSEYLACLKSAGLSPEFDPEDLMGRGLYVGLRPG